MHHDDVYGSRRAAFACQLHAHRSAIAEDLGTLLGAITARPLTPLMVRTLVERVGKAVETGDPDLVLHWCRMVRDIHDGATITRLVENVCDYVVAFGTSVGLDAETLGTFLDVVKARTREGLRVADEPRRNERVTRAAIDAVLALLRARDERAFAHAHEVAEWSQRVATAMQLSDPMTKRIVGAALLHDVGKIGTPDEVLNKPGPLSGPEWALMRQHATFGAEIILDIPALAPYAPIVRSHHERIDGQGYPDGLTADRIPLEARVIAVTDAFCDMLADRPDRAAFSYGTALAILRGGRGTQWDAAVVDVTLRVAVGLRNEAADADLARLHDTTVPVMGTETISETA